MLTLEETSVLRYLRGHGGATLADVARSCLDGTAPEWAGRVVANLDWLGYVTTFGDTGDGSAVLMLTSKGSESAGRC